MNSESFPKRKRIFACPETILLIHPDATTMDVDVDMLSAVIKRSVAMVEILSDYFQTPEECRSGTITNAMLDDFIWQLSGNLHLVQQIIETAPMRAEKEKLLSSNKLSGSNRS